MQDTGLRKVHGNVAVGVGRTVVFQLERRAVELERAVTGKDVIGNAAGAEGEKIVVPVLNALHLLQICACSSWAMILGCCMQPFIAVGVVEVPVRIDQVSEQDRHQDPLAPC